MTQNETSGSNEPRSRLRRYVEGNLKFIAFATILVGLMSLLKHPTLATAIWSWAAMLAIAGGAQALWRYLWHVKQLNLIAEVEWPVFVEWAAEKNHLAAQWIYRHRVVLIVVSIPFWTIGMMIVTISTPLPKLGGVVIGIGGAVLLWGIGLFVHWYVTRPPEAKAETDVEAGAEAKDETEPDEDDLHQGLDQPVPEDTEAEEQPLSNSDADTVVMSSATDEEPTNDALEALRRVLVSRDRNLLVEFEGLLEERDAVRRRNYDLSLAPQLEELPSWIRDKVGQDEQVHGVIRKAWPHAIPPLFSLACLALIGWALVTHVTGKPLLISLIVWAILVAAAVIWFMKHIRWALLLTDQRFVRLSGVLQLDVRAIERSKITDFSTKRTVRGRIFRFWNLKVETAGQVQAFDVEGLLAGGAVVCTYYEQHLGRGQ